jgi:hypothetical protein
LYDNREMTKNLLIEASYFDQGFHARLMQHGSPMVDSWAATIEGKTWPEESIWAVRDFYSGPKAARPILPVDVIDRCAACPPWSSREHAWSWIGSILTKPFSPALEVLCGVEVPEFPEASTRSAVSAARVAWGRENLPGLLDAVMNADRKEIPEWGNRWDLRRWP